MSFDKDPQQLFLECAAKPTPNSFKALYDATQMRLFPVCLRILKDHELAQDCLQASYVKVWHNLNNYDAQKSKAVTWMSRIIRNQALDMLKRKNFVDFVDDVPDMIDPSLQHEDQVLVAEQSALLKQCLDVLKREDVKTEMKLLLNPIIEFILFEIRPYTYVTILLLFMIFVMVLANLALFIWFMRNKGFFRNAE